MCSIFSIYQVLKDRVYIVYVYIIYSANMNVNIVHTCSSIRNITKNDND